MRYRGWFVGGALLIGLSLAGCDNAKSVPTAKVKGTVTFQGTPVENGQVNFESDPPGYGAVADIKQGAFEINDVALATYKVTVTPPPPLPPVPGETSDVEDPPDIPAKYRTLTTSDLTAEVNTGENEFTFELE